MSALAEGIGWIVGPRGCNPLLYNLEPAKEWRGVIVLGREDWIQGENSLRKI